MVEYTSILSTKTSIKQLTHDSERSHLIICVNCHMLATGKKPDENPHIPSSKLSKKRSSNSRRCLLTMKVFFEPLVAINLGGGQLQPRCFTSGGFFAAKKNHRFFFGRFKKGISIYQDVSQICSWQLTYLHKYLVTMKWSCKGLARISTISSTTDHYQHSIVPKCCEQLGNHSIAFIYEMTILGFE